ncbi:hypothetical protein HJG53_15260 [Sphingomonas sp. ID1715]|uniref:hypothetical protein n=1 Tax=Sphingomonas sp. ID1715 TaxID=1656898 RepID=UPI0014884AAD|nr:hypothetical protein [Sphingomonas sp. ID1715]NNM78250.1 hypothetical protein [Sphingomonas sp. ID1715]
MAEAGTQDAALRDPRQDAHQDKSIQRRLERDPFDADAKVDAGSDESMDASDPPAAAAPGSQEPAPSSGYDEAKERANAQQ